MGVEETDELGRQTSVGRNLKLNMKPWDLTCEKAKKAGIDLAWLGEKRLGGVRDAK